MHIICNSSIWRMRQMKEICWSFLLLQLSISSCSQTSIHLKQPDVEVLGYTWSAKLNDIHVKINISGGQSCTHNETRPQNLRQLWLCVLKVLTLEWPYSVINPKHSSPTILLFNQCVDMHTPVRWMHYLVSWLNNTDLIHFSSKEGYFERSNLPHLFFRLSDQIKFKWLEFQLANKMGKNRETVKKECTIRSYIGVTVCWALWATIEKTVKHKI